MDWLITGGCGFLGTSLVRALFGEGAHRLRVLDDLSVGSLSALQDAAPVTVANTAALAGKWRPETVQFVRGDVRDARLAERVARGCHVIVHLAANAGVERSIRDPRADCAANVLGTLHYLEAARHGGVRRFVFASSSASVGEVEPPIHEELVPRPASPYGAGKLAGEAYCGAYHRAFGIETVALRFGNVYGPGSSHKASVVAQFLRRALCGQPLEIYGDGAQSRDFVYVSDLVRAIRAAATAMGVGGEVFQIASGREMSIEELVGVLLPILARRGVPGVATLRAAPRVGDLRRSYADTTKARRLLGWRAEVSVAEGLEQTLAWFQAQSPPPAVSAVGGAR